MNKETDTKMIVTDFSDCMKQSYLNYSMSVITARALPDIRDGLKPVQRRTLFAMHELGLSHDKPHRKCARIVGDTMGKYHPHGDSSIYEALVVMSQDFKRNEPLADPHGNFGSIEGDGAAAMRYTEARLQKLTETVYLADLEKNVVDFVPNFDETEKEPEVLPVRIPNILVNGAEGIAVGMTTNIPSHNLKEVIDCAKAYIDNPDITTEELLKIMPGPDFSTGGIVANQEDLPAIYESGSGKIRLRGKLEVEAGKKRSDKDKLIVSEIPYTMIGDGIRKFLSDTAALAESRKLPEITDISNESSKEGIRIVLELKKGADIERVKNILYKKTRLEDTFSVNMIAIVDGKPALLGLKDILKHFLDFQLEVNRRKYEYMLAEELKKKEIQEGLIEAVDIIDLIIEIIRGSKTRAQAMACLMGDPKDVKFRHPESLEQAKLLHFTERQAQAILDLRLARLIGLEILALQKAYKETCTRIKLFTKILKQKSAMLDVIKKDLDRIREEFGHDRRTLITSLEQAVEVKEEVKEEEVVFLMDRFGYVKVIDRALAEKNAEAVAEYKYSFSCMNTGRVQFFTKDGKMHQVKIKDIPLMKLKDKGVPIDNISNYDSRTEDMIYAASLQMLSQEKLIFLTAAGLVKKVPVSEFETSSKTVTATKLAEGDCLIAIEPEEKKQIVLRSEKGAFLRFECSEIPESKKNTLGQKAMQLVDEDRIRDVRFVNPSEESEVVYKDYRIELKRIKLSARGNRGIKLRL